jgi:hypothetical protein
MALLEGFSGRVPFHLFRNIHATGPLYFPVQLQNHAWMPQILRFSPGVGARRMLEHTTSTWLLTAGCGSKASPAPLLCFPGTKVSNTYTPQRSIEWSQPIVKLNHSG